MPIRHAVLFRFAEDATEEQIAALAAGLSDMPGATRRVAADRYRHGRALGLNPGTWDYAVVAEFASPDDYEAYRDQPRPPGADPRAGGADHGRTGVGAVRGARPNGRGRWAGADGEAMTGGRGRARR